MEEKLINPLTPEGEESEEQGKGQKERLEVEERIAFVAAGNGAGSAAFRSKRIWRKKVENTGVDVERADFFALNINDRAFSLLQSEQFTTLKLGTGSRQGAGHNPAVGRAAFFESIEEVRKLFQPKIVTKPDGKRVKVVYVKVYIIAAMLKGTGGGVTLALALLTRDELGIPTVIQALMPGRCEGSSVQRRRAEQQLQELLDAGFRVVVIENQAAFDREEQGDQLSPQELNVIREQNQVLGNDVYLDEALAWLDQPVAESWVGFTSIQLREEDASGDPEDVKESVDKQLRGGLLSVGAKEFKFLDPNDWLAPLQAGMKDLFSFWYGRIEHPINHTLLTYHGPWKRKQMEKIGEILEQFADNPEGETDCSEGSKRKRKKGNEGYFPIIASYVPRPTLTMAADPKGDSQALALENLKPEDLQQQKLFLTLMLAGPVVSTPKTIVAARRAYNDDGGQIDEKLLRQNSVPEASTKETVARRRPVRRQAPLIATTTTLTSGSSDGPSSTGKETQGVVESQQQTVIPGPNLVMRPSEELDVPTFIRRKSYIQTEGGDGDQQCGFDRYAQVDRELAAVSPQDRAIIESINLIETICNRWDAFPYVLDQAADKDPAVKITARQLLLREDIGDVLNLDKLSFEGIESALENLERLAAEGFRPSVPILRQLVHHYHQHHPITKLGFENKFKAVLELGAQARLADVRKLLDNHRSTLPSSAVEQIEQRQLLLEGVGEDIVHDFVDSLPKAKTAPTPKGFIYETAAGAKVAKAEQEEDKAASDNGTAVKLSRKEKLRQSVKSFLPWGNGKAAPPVTDSSANATNVSGH
jgi:hypothetical protein